MRCTRTILALLLVGAAAPAIAQGRDIGVLSGQVFSAWDENADGVLTGDEFVGGLHEAFAHDGRLDRGEYETEWDTWFAGLDRPDFTRLDVDADGALSPAELGEGLARAGIGRIFPGAADGALDEQEFREGLTAVVAPGGEIDRMTFDVVALNAGVPVQDVEAGDVNVTRGEVTVDRGEAGETAALSQSAGQVNVGQVIALSEFQVEAMYPEAMSADEFLGTEVYGAGGEEIGDVEDLVVSSDGRVVSLIAEVGGFWDIGDTHVSIPWTEVVARPGGGVLVPVTEDTVDEYSLFAGEEPDVATLSEEVRSGLDDQELGPRAWRISELVGDFARIRQDEGFRDYGYVSDVLIDGGRVVAAVVNPDYTYGIRGPIAYPYYGEGFRPGSRYYDMPYDEDEVRAGAEAMRAPE